MSSENVYAAPVEQLEPPSKRFRDREIPSKVSWRVAFIFLFIGLLTFPIVYFGTWIFSSLGFGGAQSDHSTEVEQKFEEFSTSFEIQERENAKANSFFSSTIAEAGLESPQLLQQYTERAIVSAYVATSFTAADAEGETISGVTIPENDGFTIYVKEGETYIPLASEADLFEKSDDPLYAPQD